MADRKVKGTMMLDLVRMIRANKKMDWNKYLKPGDREFIDSMILQSKWYPMEIYQRFGWILFQTLAGGNLELVRLRGRERGRELFTDIYKSIIADHDPMKALNKLVTIYSSLFNFSSLTFENSGEKHAKVYHDYDPKDPANVPYCHQLMGHFDTLVELTGGRNARINLTARQWDGAPKTVFDITWQ